MTDIIVKSIMGGLVLFGLALLLIPVIGITFGLVKKILVGV